MNSAAPETLLPCSAVYKVQKPVRYRERHSLEGHRSAPRLDLSRNCSLTHLAADKSTTLRTCCCCQEALESHHRLFSPVNVDKRRLSECAAPRRRDRSHSVRKLWNFPPISTESGIDCDDMLTETFSAQQIMLPSGSTQVCSLREIPTRQQSQKKPCCADDAVRKNVGLFLVRVRSCKALLLLLWKHVGLRSTETTPYNPRRSRAQERRRSQPTTEIKSRNPPNQAVTTLIGRRPTSPFDEKANTQEVDVDLRTLHTLGFGQAL